MSSKYRTISLPLAAAGRLMNGADIRQVIALGANTALFTKNIFSIAIIEVKVVLQLAQMERSVPGKWQIKLQMIAFNLVMV